MKTPRHKKVKTLILLFQNIISPMNSWMKMIIVCFTNDLNYIHNLYEWITETKIIHIWIFSKRKKNTNRNMMAIFLFHPFICLAQMCSIKSITHFRIASHFLSVCLSLFLSHILFPDCIQSSIFGKNFILKKKTCLFYCWLLVSTQTSLFH